jgi:hypothetical protein
VNMQWVSCCVCLACLCGGLTCSYASWQNTFHIKQRQLSKEGQRNDVAGKEPPTSQLAQQQRLQHLPRSCTLLRCM